MTVVDLDNPADVDRLWELVQRRHEVQTIDPRLRADVLRAVDQALERGAICDERAAAIKLELEEAHPAIVLAAHSHDLLENRPSIGAFPRRTSNESPTATEWVLEDPQRLGNVVHEMARFSSDLQVIVVHVLELAEAAGIDEEVADEVVRATLRTMGTRRVGR